MFSITYQLLYTKYNKKKIITELKIVKLLLK